MSRRDGTERVLIVNTVIPGGSGNIEVLPPDADVIYSPRQLFVSSVATSGTTYWSLFDGANLVAPGAILHPESTQENEFADGLELTKGSGVYFASTNEDLLITLYYVAYDEPTPITKEAARAATYTAHLTLPKAIRTPNRRGEQSEG